MQTRAIKVDTKAEKLKNSSCTYKTLPGSSNDEKTKSYIDKMEKIIKKGSFYVDRNLRSRSRRHVSEDMEILVIRAAGGKDLGLLGEYLLVEVPSWTGSVWCATRRDVMLRSAEMY